MGVSCLEKFKEQTQHVRGLRFIDEGLPLLQHHEAIPASRLEIGGAKCVFFLGKHGLSIDLDLLHPWGFLVVESKLNP